MKRIVAVLVLVACGGPLEIDRPQPLAGEEPEARALTTLPPKVAVDFERVRDTATAAQAYRRVVSDATTLIQLRLDDETVFCTSLGYGAFPFLKVSIPQLDQLAHFDHRVEGTDLPCAAVGACTPEMNTSHILQGNPGIEPVYVRVVLTEHLERDRLARTCRRQLVEDVSLTVRGVPLFHHVEGGWEDMPFEHCAR